jgi:hypothetical protein
VGLSVPWESDGNKSSTEAGGNSLQVGAARKWNAWL